MEPEKRCLVVCPEGPPPYQHRKGISRENPASDRTQDQGRKGWMEGGGSKQSYSTLMVCPLTDQVSRELPGVRDERVVGLDCHGSPNKELRQDSLKD